MMIKDEYTLLVDSFFHDYRQVGKITWFVASIYQYFGYSCPAEWLSVGNLERAVNR